MSVEAGMGVGPVGFSVEQQNLLWVMWRRGDSIRETARTLGETLPRIILESAARALHRYVEERLRA